MDMDNNEDLWIGMSNLANKGYKWTDGSAVGYTGWARGQPTRTEYMVRQIPFLGRNPYTVLLNKFGYALLHTLCSLIHQSMINSLHDIAATQCFL